MFVFTPIPVVIFGIVGLMLLVSLGRGIHGLAVAVALAVAAGVMMAFFMGYVPAVHEAATQTVNVQLRNLAADVLPAETGSVNIDVAPQQAKAEADEPSDQQRPTWLAINGRLIGKEYQIAVASGLYVTLAECRKALTAAEQQAVGEYLDNYLGDGAAGLVSLDSRYIRDHLQRAEYAETVQASIGTMQQIHGWLVFDDSARSEFHGRWRQALIIRRLCYVGGGAALVLVALASAFGYLLASNRTEAREPVLR